MRVRTEPADPAALVIGALVHDPDVALQAPDTVSAGVTFFVSITTEGSACETAAGGDVTVGGLEATITPLNRRYRGLCTLQLVLLRRLVPLRFDAAGTAVIRARGAGERRATRGVLVRPVR